ncbi:MarR family transcriptional regulator [Streptomyces triticagri]|uniref:MarR family transcriptional regulator n=1 Tax=Streptomyces triticagri TaxID=2293568 RepID=A0A372M4T9_9ACTN|nr:MarR family transcriptional regulator [Streptomyces triticagri]RFU85958.1 MarR family transcriptional regulator [Streptomyces triticagri]
MTRAQQDLLSRTALDVFRLNGQFLRIADELASPAGLSAAWWQVLGAVLDAPDSVSGIARTMGITRQSVQRIADRLVADGLADYAPNPAHRRAKLVTPTDRGRAAVRRIDPGHALFAARLAAELGEAEFAETARVLDRLSAAMSTVLGEDTAAKSGAGSAPGPDAGNRSTSDARRTATTEAGSAPG